MSQAGANTKYLIFFPPYSYVPNERRKISKFFGLMIVDFEYGSQKISFWPNKKLKNNKLATLNGIHLLYGALRTNSICYCDSLSWYLSENNYFRLSFCFARLKIIAWNHNKINFLWFLLLIFMFHPEYLLSKLCFSERTPRVLLETTIKTRGYLGWKKKLVVKMWKNTQVPEVNWA